MKRYCLIIGIALALTGCTTTHIRLLWDQPGAPSAIGTPPGFQITPKQAYDAVYQAPWRLSPKHLWHVYADDHNYYIVDALFGSSPRSARKYGVIIDGQTGQLKNSTEQGGPGYPPQGVGSPDP